MLPEVIPARGIRAQALRTSLPPCLRSITALRASSQFSIHRDRSADLIPLAIGDSRRLLPQATRRRAGSSHKPIHGALESTPAISSSREPCSAGEHPAQTRKIRLRDRRSWSHAPPKIESDQALVERASHHRARPPSKREKRSGRRCGAQKNPEKHLHNLLIPLEKLLEHERQKAPDTINDLPVLLAEVG